MESQDLGSSSSDLSSAVEAISTEAPKLSGLEKLQSQKAFVEKNDAVPPRSGESAKSVPVAPGSPGASDVPVIYAPDFKYKAQGKDLEIPEKYRGLITDKESEEELKTLFGKSHTVDEYKSQIDNFKKNLSDTGAVLNQYKTGVQELRGHYQKGDIDTFFQKLNINPEKIYQWVLDKVNYQQLPQDQRAQLDRQRDLQRQAEMAQHQVGQASHREMQLATQVKSMQLEQTLGTGDVKSMADAFDSRVGKSGAFKDAIIEHGKSVWALSNGTVDLTPEQAVASFVQKYGNPSAFSGQASAAGAANPSPGNAPSANAAPPVKVIPNVAGRSVSPVKQKPKNLDDLRRLRDAAVKEDNSQRSPSQGYLAG